MAAKQGKMIIILQCVLNILPTTAATQRLSEEIRSQNLFSAR